MTGFDEPPLLEEVDVAFAVSEPSFEQPGFTPSYSESVSLNEIIANQELPPDSSLDDQSAMDVGLPGDIMDQFASVADAPPIMEWVDAAPDEYAESVDVSDMTGPPAEAIEGAALDLGELATTPEFAIDDELAAPTLEASFEFETEEIAAADNVLAAEPWFDESAPVDVGGQAAAEPAADWFEPDRVGDVRRRNRCGIVARTAHRARAR